jgi:hypothetical protein
MKLTSKSLHSRLIKHLRAWHRKLGIFAAFFIIFLSLSGMALNHTTALSLAHQPINSSWLLNHYGIASPKDVRFYQNTALQVTDNLLWLNGKVILESNSELIAATFINAPENIVLAASSDQVYLYNFQGELIDQLGEDFDVPTNISALSIDKNNVVVKTPVGYFQTNTDFLVWQEVNFVTEPAWIKPSSVSDTLVADAELAYRSQFLTLERIVLDAHSGRIFGIFGVLFMDFVAILLILLSLSGLYIWIRYARAKR